jgi:hypothetical protein
MTTTTLAPAVRRRRTPVARTTRHLLAMLLFLAAWFWGLAIVVVSLVLVMIDRFGEVENSVLQFVRQGGIWFPFSLAVIIATTYLPIHVAAGMTRRAFATAALLAAAVTVAVYAGAMTLLLQAERAVFSAAGWPHTMSDVGFSATSGDVGRILGDYLLTFGCGVVSGLLVGIVYYRAGGWWGTLALPLTVGPLLLVTGLLYGDAGPFDLTWLGERFDAGDADVLVRGAVCVLVLVVQATAFHRLTRSVALRPVTT